LITYPTVRISRKGALRIASGHPWVFSSDIADSGGAAGGAVVRVTEPQGRFLGLAHYSSASQISLRMLTREPEVIDRAFYFRRLAAAAAYRAQRVQNSDAYRLVNSEADFLPGLIVDRYGSALVVQTLNQGMDLA
jgi:23S rRNA (cytosine1962-C5)-methyltransferase